MNYRYKDIGSGGPPVEIALRNRVAEAMRKIAPLSGGALPMSVLFEANLLNAAIHFRTKTAMAKFLGVSRPTLDRWIGTKKRETQE